MFKGTKITKGLANRLFNENVEVMIAPEKLFPGSKNWDRLMVATCAKDAGGKTFAEVCDAISFYSCNDVNGMNLSFFAKEL